MEALQIAGITIGAGVIISFWGWLAVTVVKTNAKVAELEQRMNDKDSECVERMGSINSLFEKTNKIAADTAYIRGKLEVAL